jgi:hypothetical protein
MEELYFREDYLSLYIDKSARTVRAVWNGFLSGETLRLAVKQCLQLLTAQQPHYWLADNRKMKAIRQKDQEWMEMELVPKLVASPLRKMATLVSEDIFNQLAIENLHNKASGQIKFDHQYFKNEKVAEQWLHENNPVTAGQKTGWI